MLVACVFGCFFCEQRLRRETFIINEKRFCDHFIEVWAKLDQNSVCCEPENYRIEPVSANCVNESSERI